MGDRDERWPTGRASRLQLRPGRSVKSNMQMLTTPCADSREALPLPRPLALALAFHANGLTAGELLLAVDGIAAALAFHGPVLL